MHVKVRHTLTNTIVHRNKSTFSIHRRLNAARDKLKIGKELIDQAGRQVRQRLDVFLRNQKRVSVEQRSIVQECQCSFILKDDCGLEAAGNDLAKHARWVGLQICAPTCSLNPLIRFS